MYIHAEDREAYIRDIDIRIRYTCVENDKKLSFFVATNDSEITKMQNNADAIAEKICGQFSINREDLSYYERLADGRYYCVSPSNLIDRVHRQGQGMIAPERGNWVSNHEIQGKMGNAEEPKTQREVEIEQIKELRAAVLIRPWDMNNYEPEQERSPLR